jgi:hypothetical protein
MGPYIIIFSWVIIAIFVVCLLKGVEDEIKGRK